MRESKELKNIKKIYGEKFSHLCRELFPQILEQEGMLLQLLQEKFSKNCNTLYETIEENGLICNFKELIYNNFDKNRELKCEKDKEKRNPYEILHEAGYDLYECLTEDDIQGYKKYYDPNEVLCTIHNGGRINSRACFWAVRKDVDKIKREDFINPKKDDEYSTSVLAIQFDKKHNSHVEIISRYNHTVANPNCTLDNNLDNIAEGLQESFEKVLEERGYYLKKMRVTDFEIPGYTLAGDGKYYKYNFEIDGKYYCPGNIVIENGVAKEIGKPEEVLLCDYFKIDLKNGKVESLMEDIYHDTFVDDLMDIEKIEVKKDKEEQKKIIYIYKKKLEEENNIQEPIIIELDNDNQIIGYINKDVQTIGDEFLFYNKELRELNMQQVQTVGDKFLHNNEELSELNMPQVQTVGNLFLNDNEELRELNMPQVQIVGNYFLFCNKVVPKNAEKIRKVVKKENITIKEFLKNSLKQLTITKSLVQKVIRTEKDQSQIDKTKEGENLNEH